MSKRIFHQSARQAVRRTLALLFITTFLSATASAQKFGYLSHDSVLRALPAYAEVQASLQQLRQQFADEQKRVADDFNQKYEAFLDGQRSFPLTILRKRQSELQDMLERNIAFKHESQQLLKQAEAEAMAPLEDRLATVLTAIGSERGYAFILNTDQQSALWINPDMGEDITDMVINKLRD